MFLNGGLYGKYDGFAARSVIFTLNLQELTIYSKFFKGID